MNPPTRSSGGGSASIPVYRILRQIDYLTHPDGKHPRRLFDNNSNKRRFSQDGQLIAYSSDYPNVYRPARRNPSPCSLPSRFDAEYSRIIQFPAGSPSCVKTSKRKHVLLFSRIRGFSWHWRVAVAPIRQRHTRIRSNNGHRGKWRRSVGKILDRGIGFPLYFSRWTRGDLRQLAPRKKLLKSRTSTQLDFFEPSPSLARRVFHFAPTAPPFPWQFRQPERNRL